MLTGHVDGLSYNLELCALRTARLQMDQQLLAGCNIVSRILHGRGHIDKPAHEGALRRVPHSIAPVDACKWLGACNVPNMLSPIQC